MSSRRYHRNENEVYSHLWDIHIISYINLPESLIIKTVPLSECFNHIHGKIGNILLCVCNWSNICKINMYTKAIIINSQSYNFDITYDRMATVCLTWKLAAWYSSRVVLSPHVSSTRQASVVDNIAAPVLLPSLPLPVFHPPPPVNRFPVGWLPSVSHTAVSFKRFFKWGWVSQLRGKRSSRVPSDSQDIVLTCSSRRQALLAAAATVTAVLPLESFLCHLSSCEKGVQFFSHLLPWQPFITNSQNIVCA